MKNWFARWFGGSSHAGQAPPAERPTPTPESTHPDPATPASVVNPPPLLDLDLGFYRWLLGDLAHTGEAPEQLILDELARLVRDPESAAGLVPRVPAVIPQLLRSLRDDSMSQADLARQVAQDVTLVAEVIREVNSPFYRSTTRVATIEGALMLLGQNGLRMLLARVAYRPVISAQTGRLARQVAPQVWSQSEYCAQAASLAAPGFGADPFEADLAGLTQNVGLIVAFRLADQLAGAQGLPRSDAFAHALQDSARVLSARIATLWELPPPVGMAILHAGQADAPALARALYLGDRLARLRMLLDAGVEGAPEAAGALAGEEQGIFAKLERREN